MGSRIPTVRMKSRFYSFVAGEAAFCVCDQLANLEAPFSVFKVMARVNELLAK
jgi:hypothetical protein